MTARPARQVKATGGLTIIRGSNRGRPVVTPWLAFVIVVVVALFGIVSTRTTLDAGAFELAELSTQLTEAEVHNQRLRLEIARLESPGRIAPAAEELGLVYPTERSLIAVPGVVVAVEDPDPRWAGLETYAAGAAQDVTP